jgi:hypothetical protein
MTTLANLTRQAARLVTATVIGAASSAGTTTALTDTNNLANFPDGQFTGGTLWMTSGANAGLSRAVTGFTASSKQLACSAFPFAVGNGDAYEVVDDNLFTYQNLKQAVALALREIGTIEKEDHSLTVSATAIYTLPTGVSDVVKVELVNSLGNADEAATISTHWLERMGKLIFNSAPNAETIRVLYQGLHAELVNDADALDASVDEIYLVYLAARQALRLAYKRLGKQREELPEWLNEAISEMQKHQRRNRKTIVKVRTA